MSKHCNASRVHQEVDAGLKYVDTASNFIRERSTLDSITSTHVLFKRKCVDAKSWYVDAQRSVNYTYVDVGLRYIDAMIFKDVRRLMYEAYVSTQLSFDSYVASLIKFEGNAHLSFTLESFLSILSFLH